MSDAEKKISAVFRYAAEVSATWQHCPACSSPILPPRTAFPSGFQAQPTRPPTTAWRGPAGEGGRGWGARISLLWYQERQTSFFIEAGRTTMGGMNNREVVQVGIYSIVRLNVKTKCSPPIGFRETVWLCLICCRYNNRYVSSHRMFFSLNMLKAFYRKNSHWLCSATACNQLPRLIEQSSQWLSGPSLLLPAAGSPADYQTGFKVCSDALQSLFNYWHGLT